MSSRRLPRLGTLGAITALSRDEFRVSQAFADNALQRLNESALVVVFALVESERLFIAVSEQMKRLDVYIRPFQGAFEKRPEILQPVSMDLALGVAFQVVNDLAVIILFQIIIGYERIRAYRCACSNMFANVAAKLWPTSILNNFQNNARELVAAPAFKDALHGCFLDTSVANASAAILMHVARLSADVGLVRFASAAHLRNASFLHCEADALQHKPRGLLRHAKRAMQFVRANAIFAVGREPHGGKPLIQTNRRIFKDRPDLGGKLLLRMWGAAFPNLRVFKERHLVRITARTTHDLWPADADKELKSVLWIAEIRDCFEQCFGCLHASRIHP